MESSFVIFGVGIGTTLAVCLGIALLGVEGEITDSVGAAQLAVTNGLDNAADLYASTCADNCNDPSS